ncbi:MAG: hypothetical protein HC875_15250 [Anaerolineales bacterium]|nr:hypothetical protein [Anaerolineales bacterium]
MKMPRGIPIFNSGTIATGSTALDDFILLVRDQITSYQSNSQQAWEIYTGSVNLPYTGTTQNTRETWFHSVGDRSLGSGENQGDTDIWVRFHQIGSITSLSGVIGISVYQDYSPSTNIGYNFNVSSSIISVSMTKRNCLVCCF